MLQRVCSHPMSPVSLHRSSGKKMAASCEVFESVTRRYGKPAWDLPRPRSSASRCRSARRSSSSTPFCDLLHFDRDEKVVGKRYDPKVLLVAPMSGHYATLLRGTVEAMIQEHNLYITDWRDAREIPVWIGRFDLDDFIDHIIDFVRWIGTNTHVVAVCQPSVPVLAAAALHGGHGRPLPAGLDHADGRPDRHQAQPDRGQPARQSRRSSGSSSNVIDRVPWPNLGCMRRVYPGFIQLTGFMQMNLERHVEAHKTLYQNLVKGDCDRSSSTAILRGVSGRHGPAGGVLPADGRDSVPAPRSARRGA